MRKCFCSEKQATTTKIPLKQIFHSIEPVYLKSLRNGLTNAINLSIVEVLVHPFSLTVILNAQRYLIDKKELKL